MGLKMKALAQRYRLQQISDSTILRINRSASAIRSMQILHLERYSVQEDTFSIFPTGDFLLHLQ